MLDVILSLLFDMLVVSPSIVKRRWVVREEWSGAVEKKKAYRGHPLSRYGYSVVFRTEEGKRKKLLMGKADFDLYQEGRRYTKKAGAYLPDPHSAI
jgi:uncharacterized protein (UPF0128 family)